MKWVYRLIRTIELLSLAVFLLFVFFDTRILLDFLPPAQYIWIVNKLQALSTIALIPLALLTYQTFYWKRSFKFRTIIFGLLILLFVKGTFIIVSPFFGGLSREYFKKGSEGYKFTGESFAMFLTMLLIAFIVLPVCISIIQILFIRTRQKFIALLQSIILPTFFVSFIILALLGINKLYKQAFQQKYLHQISSSLYAEQTTGNQEIIYSENTLPVMQCILKEKFNLPAFFLSAVVGNSILFIPTQPMYFSGKDCFVIILGSPKEGETYFQGSRATELGYIGDLLIRRMYVPYINPKLKLRPSSSINVSNDSALYSSWGIRGYYEPTSQQIHINGTADYFFSVVIHEMLHAYSQPQYSRTGFLKNGLSEGVTQLLTTETLKHSDIMFVFNETYDAEVKAAQAIIKIVGQENVLKEYFNGQLIHLENLVDKKTYSGAFCSFSYYLDSATDVSDINALQYKLRGEKALRALTDSSLRHPSCK